MYHINETRKQNNNSKAQEKARLNTGFAPQANGNIILRHEGRVRYLEEKSDVEEFLSEIKGKNENQIRSSIRARYNKLPAH